MASPTRWAWVWVNSRSLWWTGRPGVLRFMGLQRVRHDWATELNWVNFPRMELKVALLVQGKSPEFDPRSHSQTILRCGEQWKTRLGNSCYCWFCYHWHITLCMHGRHACWFHTLTYCKRMITSRWADTTVVPQNRHVFLPWGHLRSALKGVIFEAFYEHEYVFKFSENSACSYMVKHHSFDSTDSLAIWCKELTHRGKKTWYWERLRASGEGMTENEMVGWHHPLSGHASEQTVGDSEGQGSQSGYSPCDPQRIGCDLVTKRTTIT